MWSLAPNFFLTKLKKCSIGFSHGEYWAFMSIVTFSFPHMLKMLLCLWIEALSISSTMSQF